MGSATKITVATFGVIAGLAGLEHGIGETLQGSTTPEGTVIKSWPDSAFFEVLNGEPAMTVIPNLFAAGVLTILTSLVFIVWASVFAQRKHGGLVLILLSVILLFVGGGFGPPLLGVILGITATRIRAPLRWLRTRFSSGPRRLLGRLWPWSLAIGVIAWLLLMPGVSVLSYYFGIYDPNIVIAVSLSAFGLLLFSIAAGLARDAQEMRKGGAV